MNENVFHKTVCTGCGVNVEYPSEAEGQTEPCPVCGAIVLLLKARPESQLVKPPSPCPAESETCRIESWNVEFTGMKNVMGSKPSPSSVIQKQRQLDEIQKASKKYAHAKPITNGGDWVIKLFGVGVFVGVCVVAWLFWGHWHSGANADYIKDDAYSAAKTFASRAYPGAKSFSSRDESPVVVTGGALYSVTLVVDGVNAFNAPVRNVVLVTEVQSGDHWRMLNIEQR